MLLIFLSCACFELKVFRCEILVNKKQRLKHFFSKTYGFPQSIWMRLEIWSCGSFSRGDITPHGIPVRYHQDDWWHVEARGYHWNAGGHTQLVTVEFHMPRRVVLWRFISLSKDTSWSGQMKSSIHFLSREFVRNLHHPLVFPLLWTGLNIMQYIRNI